MTLCRVQTTSKSQFFSSLLGHNRVSENLSHGRRAPESGQVPARFKMVPESFCRKLRQNQCSNRENPAVPKGVGFGNARSATRQAKSLPTSRLPGGAIGLMVR